MEDVLSDVQKAVVRQCDRSTMTGLRDAAMILLLTGFDLSREACAGLDREDVAIKDGYVSMVGPKQPGRARGAPGMLRSSSTDLDPVRAISEWLEEAAIESGPLFLSIDRHGKIGDRLSGRSVYNIVRRRAKEAGIEHYTPMMLRRVSAK